MNMDTKQLIGVGVLSVGALLMSATSDAATCGTGNGPGGTGLVVGSICRLTGTNVTWEYNIASMGAALSLFDAPTIVGDTIKFLPPAFQAESINGGGPQPTATANFIFSRVYRNAGGNILGFAAAEGGDYYITGGNSVEADLYLQAADNNDASRVSFSLNKFLASTPTALTTWNLGGTVDGTSPPLLSPPFGLPIIAAPDFSLNVQDTLSASTSLQGQHAFIQKKITLDAVVPVPAAAWLFGSALGLLGLRRRGTPA
jgi:hypothetical protein